MKEHIDDFINLISKGNTLEAIEKYYAQDICVQENNEEPRVGKHTALSNEKSNIDHVNWSKIKVKSCLFDEISGLVLGEMQIDYETLKGEVKQLNEAFMQQWDNGKVVFEKYYYSTNV